MIRGRVRAQDTGQGLRVGVEAGRPDVTGLEVDLRIEKEESTTPHAVSSPVSNLVRPEGTLALLVAGNEVSAELLNINIIILNACFILVLDYFNGRSGILF